MTPTRYTRPADEDLEGIWQYIQRENVKAANAVLRRIRRRIEQLRRFPTMGRIGRVAGTRELIVPNLRYLVIYRSTDDTIEIVRILHGAQAWPPDEGSHATANAGEE